VEPVEGIGELIGKPAARPEVLPSGAYGDELRMIAPWRLPVLAQRLAGRDMAPPRWRRSWAAIVSASRRRSGRRAEQKGFDHSGAEERLSKPDRDIATGPCGVNWP